MPDTTRPHAPLNTPADPILTLLRAGTTLTEYLDGGGRVPDLDPVDESQVIELLGYFDEFDPDHARAWCATEVDPDVDLLGELSEEQRSEPTALNGLTLGRMVDNLRHRRLIHGWILQALDDPDLKARVLCQYPAETVMAAQERGRQARWEQQHPVIISFDGRSKLFLRARIDDALDSPDGPAVAVTVEELVAALVGDGQHGPFPQHAQHPDDRPGTPVAARFADRADREGDAVRFLMFVIAELAQRTGALMAEWWDYHHKRAIMEGTADSAAGSEERAGYADLQLYWLTLAGHALAAADADPHHVVTDEMIPGWFRDLNERRDRESDEALGAMLAGTVLPPASIRPGHPIPVEYPTPTEATLVEFLNNRGDVGSVYAPFLWAEALVADPLVLGEEGAIARHTRNVAIDDHHGVDASPPFAGDAPGARERRFEHYRIIHRWIVEAFTTPGLRDRVLEQIPPEVIEEERRSAIENRFGGEGVG